MVPGPTSSKNGFQLVLRPTDTVATIDGVGNRMGVHHNCTAAPH